MPRFEGIYNLVLMYDGWSLSPYNFMQLQLTPKDLSFVGYTYKNFDAVKGLRQVFGMQLWLHWWLVVIFYFYFFPHGMREEFCDS